MKKNKEGFTLSAYTAIASCFLTLHQETNAQVIYIDIDPDIILDERTEVFGLDMDDNGFYDFAFLNSSFNTFNSIFSSFRLRQDIAFGPQTSQNAIAGILNSFSTGYGVYTNYYPFALNAGEVINNLLTWQTWGYQILALRTFYETGAINDVCDYCNWYNLDVTETINGYLGIRFIDDEEQNHYGWIRCDVKDEGRTLVIKDYAYELQADYPIVAGSTEHYVGVNNLSNLNKAVIYSFGNTIYYHLPSEEIGSEITLFDFAGKIIYSGIINETYSSISPNCLPGIYIVRITTSTQSVTRKVSLQK
ncbi:MAG: T9SS type A sorting domain-containing protein [Chitinophagales bacterium]|nr:T9SS type A sorting domain-containing protein [Chitinophagales bacterium]